MTDTTDESTSLADKHVAYKLIAVLGKIHLFEVIGMLVKIIEMQKVSTHNKPLFHINYYITTCTQCCLLFVLCIYYEFCMKQAITSIVLFTAIILNTN